MRLSEAILLGVTRFKLDPSGWTCPNGGCLLGIAGLVCGKKITSSRDISELWPWVYEQSITQPSFMRELPPRKGFHDVWLSDCVPAGIKTAPSYLIQALALSAKAGDISVERIAEWVATVEPPDPQEVKEAFETVREMPEETFAERFERIQGMTPQEWDRKLSIHRHGV